MTKSRTAVLVVEDEALVRMGIVSSLEDAGFEVYEASNYDEAIAMLVANLSIRAMFTDIDMLPGLNGLDLAIAVRHRWPPVKIIITSGHRQIRNEDLPVVGRFFGKPYDADLVAASLHEMMLAA
jgi:YesN/AraC family two-component response regulator